MARVRTKDKRDEYTESRGADSLCAYTGILHGSHDVFLPYPIRYANIN